MMEGLFSNIALHYSRAVRDSGCSEGQSLVENAARGETRLSWLSGVKKKSREDAATKSLVFPLLLEAEPIAWGSQKVG